MAREMSHTAGRRWKSDALALVPSAGAPLYPVGATNSP
eukprot:CAMPEP_0195145500 /NCGR_PEP_ID=MMETSP0448-20130528/169947_1 /TAXON_ID=66468 /ORGANISM="Heterocapsa triquestra, Strain CCMP 448" /LENGTH=37 /DNA_ID= /DNA_START= /DNA_END= /DNA_ORIENTATION=